MNNTEHVLDVIREWGEPIPPTIRDLMNATGISSTSVVIYHLEQLQAGGYIDRKPRVARGITLTEKGAKHGKEAEGELCPVCGRRRLDSGWKGEAHRNPGGAANDQQHGQAKRQPHKRDVGREAATQAIEEVARTT